METEGTVQASTKREQPRALHTARMPRNTMASVHDNPKGTGWQEYLGSNQRLSKWT